MGVCVEELIRLLQESLEDNVQAQGSPRACQFWGSALTASLPNLAAALTSFRNEKL